MQIKKQIILIPILFLFLQGCSRKPVDVYLIGDSTMANKPLEGNPERGWGQMFHLFFNRNVTIHNHAKNGRSSKSFITEGRWQTVLDSLKPGDYVFIQFGHNDEKSHDSTRYAEPHTTYKENLTKFVRQSREKGTHPILLTPVMRRRFDEEGKFYDTHGDYPDVVRESAKEMDVPLIDMHRLSEKLLVSLGEDKSKNIFIFVEPGEYPRFPEGKEDNTHFCEYGATRMAGLVAEALKKMDIPLSKYVVLKQVKE